MNLGENLVGVDEIAKILSVNKSWVYQHINVVKHYKIGKYLRFNPEEVKKQFRKE